MMTPIQRGAEALFIQGARLPEVHGLDLTHHYTWATLPETERQNFITYASAVLRAIREPSEAMLGACDNIGMEAQAENPDRAALFWQRMIDAALGDDRPGRTTTIFDGAVWFLVPTNVSERTAAEEIAAGSAPSAADGSAIIRCQNDATFAVAFDGDRHLISLPLEPMAAKGHRITIPAFSLGDQSA